MIVFLNGQFVPEERAVVSVFDRGFLYGDGLFETVRVVAGRPFCWARHLERLRQGAGFLGIAMPFAPAALSGFAEQLIARNQMPDVLLRLALSRGMGPRGYSPKGCGKASLVMSLHPAPAIDPKTPPQWRLITSSVRLPANEPLAQFKTSNKLPQILARAQADAVGAEESLLLNTDGDVVEGSASNLFWIRGRRVCTPPLASGILAGVTRAVVLELCQDLGLAACESRVSPEQLPGADAVFLSLSSVGIAEGVSLDGQALSQSPLTKTLRDAYLAQLLGAARKSPNLSEI